MRQLIAFTKKELVELLRTGKMWLLLIIFALFGIMNPAIAKLTPWLMEMLSDSMEETGMILTGIQVDALTSWTQFYKNIPMALIIFLLMISGILTAEYQKGTLVNMLTKGLSRWKVLAAKTITAVCLWSVCYWVCYGITYGYNAYFWENRIAGHVVLGAAFVYLLGVWFLALVMFLSVLFHSSSGVLAAAGGIFIGGYLLELLPFVNQYVPLRLLSAGNLLNGNAVPADYQKAVITAAVSGLLLLGSAAAIFNKKSIC